MRYLIPLFPFLSYALVRRFTQTNYRYASYCLVPFLLMNTVLVFNFNIYPFLPSKFGNIDNLRIKAQLEKQIVLSEINTQVPQYGFLIISGYKNYGRLSISRYPYYNIAAQGVDERAGLIRDDIKVIYIDSYTDFPAEEFIHEPSVHIYMNDEIENIEEALQTSLNNSGYEIYQKFSNQFYNIGKHLSESKKSTRI